MKKSYLTLDIPTSLKNKILDIVHKRKKHGKENSTQKSVVIELLEKGLSAMTGNQEQAVEKA